jgi:hypothetical protein
VRLSEKLERRDLPHAFYGYESLSHYFVQTADDVTIQQMFEHSLDCLRGFLEGE